MNSYELATLFFMLGVVVGCGASFSFFAMFNTAKREDEEIRDYYYRPPATYRGTETLEEHLLRIRQSEGR